jgi:IclR family pca regulon transcriptional regulator
MAPEDRTFVQSVERALLVIRAFDEDHQQLTLSDVSRRTGLNRAAARRFLHTLEVLGYVRSTERLFSLTPKVLQLGFAYLSSMRLPQLAEPHLRELSRQVGESTSVAVLDGADIVYVARAATSHRIMSARIAVGTRFPAYATSMGRVLLAFLPEADLTGYLERTDLRALTPQAITDPAELRDELDRIRTEGHAIVDQELELGLRSVAAPIRDRTTTVVAAVNISTAAMQPGGEDPIPPILPQLKDCAARISADLLT